MPEHDAAASEHAPVARRTRSPVATRAALVDAAAGTFNDAGYHGTDTNRIARAAGFAPQTFYRHFRDKLDVFLAVYERWQAEERTAIATAVRRVADDEADAAGARAPATEDAIVRAVLEHHVRWRGFRRSLRFLAVEDAEARKARAFSRERQIADLARLPGNAGRPRAELLAALLAVERLCDAAAEGELADSGLTEAEVLAVVRAAVRACRGR